MFIIKSDIKPDLSKAKLTEEERKLLRQKCWFCPLELRLKGY